MASNPLKDLLGAGQSFWMDNISRDMILGGQLKTFVKNDGLRGVTSNPDIFQKAITGSTLYDTQIATLARAGRSTPEIYEALVTDDIRRAADVLRPVYDESKGLDGCVSLEVSPYLAYDTEGTLVEARRLWATVDRPNLMVKVPATPAGIAAIRTLISEGINLNVTLIFSLECYADVMDAYIKGLSDRARRGQSVRRISSVASFFVSRIDVLVDKLLSARIGTPGLPADAASLQGRAAIAMAKLAYELFEKRFASKEFKALRAKGAWVQRPLWASTSTKNPLFEDVMYVEPLIGPHTVNTMPPATINAWRDHGVVRANSVRDGVKESRQIISKIASLGIDMKAATWQLQEEGVAKFNAPFDKLLDSISRKRAAMLKLSPASYALSDKQSASLKDVFDAAATGRFASRIWGQDTSVYSADPAVQKLIANRLGWLSSFRSLASRVPDLKRFVADVRKARFRHVVLLGMGGSSLCPEVCSKVFGSAAQHPKLLVLDSTSPEAITDILETIDPKTTLFISASKSGGTIETATMTSLVLEILRVRGIAKPGQHVVAITDPGSPLSKFAKAQGFRAVFENPADIGGRFSALSMFGLVPMALLGIDIETLLRRVAAYALDGPSILDSAANDAVRLGITIGTLAKAGRNKLTFVISPKLESLGDWVEQLIAESTGKEGRHVLPVVGETLADASAYSSDRTFVAIDLVGDKSQSAKLLALEKAGHPVIRIAVNSREDLGIEFLRWEVATAAMGVILGINPFDEPNVTESKNITGELLKRWEKSRKIAAPKPIYETANLSIALSRSAVEAVGRKEASSALILRELVSSANDGDFVALLAFVPKFPEYETKLQAVREHLRNSTKLATTLGFGPRFLHSTGQLHKGGANEGIFISVVADADGDYSIPERDYTFATLIAAQAAGDFEALQNHGRLAAFVQIKGETDKGLAELARLLNVKSKPTRGK